MGWTSFASGSGAATNPDHTIQRLGLQSTGAGVSFTAGSGSKGSYGAIGTTGAAISGFWLYGGNISSGTHRVLVDLFTDGSGTTVKVPNIAFFPGGSRWHWVYIPLAVAGTTEIGAKVQGTTNVTFQLYIRAVTAHSSLAPGFANAEAIVAADTTNTRPASNTINATTSDTTWTELVASTSRAYGAILAQAQTTATPNPGGVGGNMALATGAASSEVIISDTPVRINTSNPQLDPFLSLAQKSVASGTRLSGRILASNAGAPDPFCMGAIGFYD